jgi:hypothetical protein
MSIIVLVLLFVREILFVDVLLSILIFIKTIVMRLSVNDLFDFLVYLILLSHHSLMCKLQRIILQLVFLIELLISVIIMLLLLSLFVA